MFCICVDVFISYQQQPGIGGEVVPHQDNSFLYTEPQTCTGLWLALEDATIVNGCLWAITGSHKNGLVRRFIRGEDGVYFDRPSPTYQQKDFVPIEVQAGSLVVIHGDLIHQSFENQSPKSRHAYSLHVVDTDGCKWAQENWLVLDCFFLALCFPIFQFHFNVSTCK
ncbi:PhyH domain-containing protein [Cephalotus follicularis]|uniref:PhyH domain-containing protein n=1 Tax=Cephalotus follicularis TaxID=3775 RepID=A0A1Q3CZW9_CEPFO|nr:PhyH domain-containing protein [Cephalotus follicularis]